MRLPVPASSYAVLIGTSTYRNGDLAGLPAVRHNLDDLAAILTDPDLGGLPADHCVVVPDPTDVRALYQVLREHAARATDTLLVYFAGHGLTGPRNDLYLSLTDTDARELPVSALAYDLVRDVIADSPARNRAVILDCCFSGRAAADMAGEEAVYGQVGIEGTYVLAATSANAVALAPPGARHTAFTGELLQLLRSGVPEGPELLTFGVIYRHLLHTTTSRGLPVPRQRGTGTADLLALTRNPAHTAHVEGTGDAGAFATEAPPIDLVRTDPDPSANSANTPDPPSNTASKPTLPATAGWLRRQRTWHIAAVGLAALCATLLALAGSSTSWNGTPWIDVAAVALTQGLGSVLPVSWSAHLTLAGRLFLDHTSITGGVAALLPTIGYASTLAMLAYFAGDLWRAARAAATEGSFLRGGRSLDARLAWYFILGAVASLVALPVLSLLSARANLWMIAVGVTTTAIVLGIAEKAGRKQRDLSGSTARDGLLISAAYCVTSLLPGTSSPGFALAAGLVLGFTRVAALRLALLFTLVSRASITPLILLTAGTTAKANAGPATMQMLVGALAAFALTYGALAVLFRYVQRRSLYPFTAYQLLLAGLVVVLLATGTISAS
ncbi:caspase family protein [Lentzea alba]|uniref:caspase, EACC1-associated type n=1 Tax=Lentzea alba TaxID=2714351 RepID=UPI0039BFD13F